MTNPALTTEHAAPWSRAPVPSAAAALEAAGYPAHLAALLARRGIADADTARRFMAPEAGHLHSCDGMAGLAAALDALVAVRDRGGHVVVVGDYDVDGVSSTALLLVAFRACGLTADAILPERLVDGYGLQLRHVEEALRRRADLLVTVDCGTSAHEPIAAATAAGLAVVVVDHHLPDGSLPAGAVVVNPKQDGCGYPFRHLSAAGLALKLALALGERVGRPLPLEPLLRVACLGTVADMVPLVGENRVIAALGLAALAGTRSAGLQALFRQARVRPPFAAADIGFRLGPRLNAAGRLASAGAALELLLTRDQGRASDICRRLEELNDQRRAAEQQVVDDARRWLEQDGESLPPVVVLWSPRWHRGVVGIAASRVARRYHRPTLLLAVEGDTATGSGRSVAGVHLHEFLAPWRQRLLRFGGHAQAVGLTAGTAELEQLRRAWVEAAARWPADALVRRREYELELAPGELGPGLVRDLARLEPHGEGNPQPLVRMGPLRLASEPRVFGRGNLRAIARGHDGATVSLVGWGWEERREVFAGSFEVLGHVERDRLSGAPQLRLVDGRICDG